MTKITRAISIRQPYVELIFRGQKKFEYRPTPTGILERVFIYAAKKPAADEAAWRKAKCQPGDLPTGKILGTVEIKQCYGSDGDFRYRLVEPKRLRKSLVPKNQPQPKFFFPFATTRGTR